MIKRFAWLMFLLAWLVMDVSAEQTLKKDTVASVKQEAVATVDSAAASSQEDITQMSLEEVAKEVGTGEVDDMLSQLGLHNTLKTKFIQCNVWFKTMMALVLGMGLPIYI